MQKGKASSDHRAASQNNGIQLQAAWQNNKQNLILPNSAAHGNVDFLASLLVIATTATCRTGSDAGREGEMRAEKRQRD